MPLTYPMINGVRMDFSSVDIKVNGALTLLGVKSLNYKDSLSPGEMRGNKAHLIGRTRGKYEASADMEVYKSEWAAFVRDNLGDGYMEKSFQILAQHSERSTPDIVHIDTLQGCRIKEVSEDKAEGEEPLVVKVSMTLMYILRDGISPLDPWKSFI